MNGTKQNGQNGKCFIHVFGHKHYTYPFETNKTSNWMARNFFTGGIMPCEKLFSYFQKELSVIKTWRVNGIHYHKSCEAWLKNHKKNKKEILSIFKEHYQDGKQKKRWIMWKIFFLACSELFRYNSGSDWMVFHYLIKKKDINIIQATVAK